MTVPRHSRRCPRDRRRSTGIGIAVTFGLLTIAACSTVPTESTALELAPGGTLSMGSRTSATSETVSTPSAPTTATTPAGKGATTPAPPPTGPTPATAHGAPAATTSARAPSSKPPTRPSPKPTRPTASPTRPPAGPTPPPPPPGGPSDAYEVRMVALINAQRAAAGVRAVTAQACPDAFAEPWSPRMAAAGTLSHQSLAPLVARCGARTAAENVGFTTDQTPEALMALFMASPPHRAAILNPSLTGVGVGAYRDGTGKWWVTQDFVG